MSVRRLSKTFISGAGAAAEKSSSFLAGYSPAIDEMDLIERITVGAGGTSAIEFDLIPQTYQHLQIRIIAKWVQGTNQIQGRFNDDQNSVYTYHQIYGDGVSVSALSTINNTDTQAFGYIYGGTNNQQGGSIVDIIDYTSTQKTKVIRSISGYDTNGAGIISIRSGLWNNTSSINKITLFSGYTWSENSIFSLYGVKA